MTFEADHLEPGVKAGWSVLIVGPAEDLGSTAEAVSLRDSVRHWARGTRPHVLRIRAGEVTGRRLHPDSGEIVIVRWESDAE
jgi:hypothetical protein